MRRRVSESVKERNEVLLARIREIKGDHPYWGYRRVWAYLRYVDRVVYNKKRVYRVMKENRLTVKPGRCLRAKRTSNRPKPRADRPNQWWGIDMTKVLTEGGWVYIVVVLDWYTKKIVGHYSGSTATTTQWLEGLNRGLNTEFPMGVRGQGLKLMSDNGSQPTSVKFMKACSELEITQVFTSYSNPKGNADTERMIRTIKEELVWLREWSGERELTKELDKWVQYYNNSYLHSAHGYKAPVQAHNDYYKNNKNYSNKTILNAA